MDGLKLTPLKIIDNPKGNILHIITKSSEGYIDFGEAYFTTINFNEIKGWKRHTKLTLNLVVPVGEILIVVTDKKTFNQYKLSKDNYKRLTIPSGYWVAFMGLSYETNLMINVANFENDPTESENLPISDIEFNWPTLICK